MRDFCLVLEDEHKSSREGFVAKGPPQTLVRPHLGLSVTDLSTNLAVGHQWCGSDLPVLSSTAVRPGTEPHSEQSSTRMCVYEV